MCYEDTRIGQVYSDIKVMRHKVTMFSHHYNISTYSTHTLSSSFNITMSAFPTKVLANVIGFGIVWTGVLMLQVCSSQP